MAIKRLLATLATGALLLTGCTGGGGTTAEEAPVDTSKVSGEITFQTWALKGDRFSPYFEKLIADFEAEHPGTKINWIDQPSDGYEDKVLQQANAGNLPDVVNLPEGMAINLAKAGKLSDLKAAAGDKLDAYVPGAIAAYSRAIEGQAPGTYGYPWYLGTDVSWWRKDKLAEAGVPIPKTLDEYFESAKLAAERTNGEVKLIDSLPGLVELGGAKAFDGKQFTFNHPEAVAVVERFAELNRVGAMPPEVLSGSSTDNSKFFVQGKVAFVSGTGSFAAQLQKEAPGLAPQIEVGPRLVTPPLFVQGLSVARESKNPALAHAFAQYVTNNDNQLAFVQIARGFLPGTKAGNADAGKLAGGVTDPLMVQAMTLAGEQMPRAELNKPIEYTDDMHNFTKQQLGLAITGKISAQEALDKSVQYANDKLVD